MSAWSFPGKLFQFICSEWAERPNLLNHRFYEHLHAKDKQFADMAREVKVCLLHSRFAAALTICDQMLVMHPGNPLFEGLRLEVESRESESRIHYIQHLCRKLDSVPELDQRVALLKQALDRYPSESRLVQLLKHAVFKRDFIASLIAQSGNAESCDKYEDALERWYTIRECHPAMPGVEPEIGRLEGLLQTQLRARRRVELLADVHQLLALNEYERARDRCSDAIEEFPDDDELSALKTSAQEKVQRAFEVQRLIDEGVASLDAGQADAALKGFRAARSLDRNNLQVHSLIGAALLHKLKAVMDNDWRTADLLLEEARELIPDHPDLERISFEVANRQREANGQAPVVLQEPSHPAEELLPLPPAPENPLYNYLLRVQHQFKAMTAASHPEFRRLIPRAALAGVVLLSVAGLIWWSVAVARRRSERSELPQVVGNTELTTLIVASIPAESEVLIDGKAAGQLQAPIQLAAGKHNVVVTSTGYESQTIPVNLGTAPQTLNVALQPIPLDLHIVTDQRSGRVWMDDKPKGNLNADGLIISGVVPGSHKLKVRSPEGEVTTVFNFRAGEVPNSVSLPSRRSPAILFVGSSGEKSRVECNCAPAALRIENWEQPLAAQGLELPLSEGGHSAELSVLGGRKLTIQGSRVPVATVALYWGDATAAGRKKASADSMVQEVNAMIGNRQYQAALVRISQAQSTNPADDRVPVLQKRLERLIAIDP